MLIRQH